MPLYLRNLLLVLLCFFFFSPAKSQYIITYAGDGFNGNIGNGFPALCAGIPYTRGISFDGNNTIYLTCSNSIRKINIATGIITNLCGSDTYGSTGDGGPAANALLQSPFDVCADSINNIVYVAEYGGHRIRKIDINTGIISTLAGNSAAGYSGDGGPAVNASLNKPISVCLDYKGNLYIADMYNSRIRKIDLATGIITTCAGTGTPSYSGDGGLATNAGIAYPNKICSDLASNIYISEVASGITSRIRKINALTGIITTIAGNNNYVYGGDGGLAVNASLLDPSGVLVDKQNNVYISEYDDSRIRKIDAATGIINTIAGNGTNGFSGDGSLAATAMLHYPLGLTMDKNNNLYVADNNNHRIRQISFGTAAPPFGVTLTITASGTSACTSNPITFTATATNAGVNPIYQWQKNGINVGTNSSVYTNNNFTGGDIITCSITTDLCATVVNVTSNAIVLTGTPVQPSISINTPVTKICTGTPATFTPAPVNCGANPTYQWKINGIGVVTGPVFTSSVLVNGDIISCVVTVDPANTCANSTTATSNAITMEVSTGVPPTVQLSAPATTICTGTSLQVTAALSNAGNNYTLEWILNGVKVAQNVLNFSFSNLAGTNNNLYCILTAVNNTCYTMPVYSNTLTLAVYPLPAVSILPADTIINPGSNVTFTTTTIPANSVASYSWQPATQLINPLAASAQTISLFQTTPFTLTCLTNNGCTVTASATVKVSRKLFMPNTFTPNNDSKNDVFRIPPATTIDLVSFIIYDRWGEKVFITTDKNVGWDGTIGGRKKDQGVYVYVITMIENNIPVEVKGSFMLVR